MLFGGKCNPPLMEIEKRQKKCLNRHFGVKSTTLYPILLETGRRPIDLYTIQRVYQYTLRVKTMPQNHLLKAVWEFYAYHTKNTKQIL